MSSIERGPALDGHGEEVRGRRARKLFILLSLSYTHTVSRPRTSKASSAAVTAGTTSSGMGLEPFLPTAMAPMALRMASRFTVSVPRPTVADAASASRPRDPR